MNKFSTLLLLLLFFKLQGQEFKVNLNKLTAETQQLSESPDAMRLIWWIPIEFWQSVFEQDETMPQSEIDEFLQTFKAYTTVAVLDGTIGPFGTVNYASKNDIAKNLSLFGNNNKEYRPLDESEIDEQTKNALSILKPVLANMLGPMGENMHFYLFKDVQDPLLKLADASKEGAFRVRLDTEDFNWKLPLSSLVKQKKCPVDGALLDGTWTFCPYHGDKLVEQ